LNSFSTKAHLVNLDVQKAKNIILNFAKDPTNKNEKSAQANLMGKKTTLETSGEDVKTTLQTSGEDVKTTLETSGEDVSSDMQCMWFQFSLAKAHFKLNQWNLSLKYFDTILAQFYDIQLDEIDFNTYCTRSNTTASFHIAS
jgi:hypothetical protein